MIKIKAYYHIMKKQNVLLITLISLFIISNSYSEDSEKSHIERWDEWKDSILTSSGLIQAQEATIIDFDENMNQKRERKISGSRVSRIMDSNDNSFPAGFSLEKMPFIFFEIPWKPEDFHNIEASNPHDSKGLTSTYFSDREVSGELWFNQANGDLIKTVLRFDGNEYPRITIHYKENSIDSMIILTEPDGGFLAPHFREIQFKY
jgi:hypothetical protein